MQADKSLLRRPFFLRSAFRLSVVFLIWVLNFCIVYFATASCCCFCIWAGLASLFVASSAWFQDFPWDDIQHIIKVSHVRPAGWIPQPISPFFGGGVKLELCGSVWLEMSSCLLGTVETSVMYKTGLLHHLSCVLFWMRHSLKTDFRRPAYTNSFTETEFSIYPSNIFSRLHS